MFGKRKENHEVQDPDVVKEKQNFSKDDIFRQLMEEYTSSKRNLLIKLRQKRITDAEFMDDVDNTLHKIDAVIDVKEQARTMFYQYVFSYFRLTSLIEDPEISDIHCIAYNKIRVKKKGKRQGADIQFASNQEYREFIERVATQNGVNISNLNAIQRFADDETDPAYILRFTLITPIITTYGNPYLIIRKFPKNFPEIQDLVRENFMPQKLADSLVERFRIGSTLICGGNSDGKSTLLNALKETLPEDMAVMVAQQADELTTKHHPDMIFLHSLAESAESAVKYDLEQLSIASLTMDVDFFIVGEVKGTEAMYLINAAYTGQISAATVHSLSAQAAPEKIVDYALQATGNKYNRAELLKMIADCYHTVVNVKINMGLNDQWEDPTGLISSPVRVEQYIVYNVRGSEVEVTSFGEGLNYSATETLGSATSPNGQVIESTSVYSRISYQVDGYFGVTVPAEKDKLVDIVKNN